MRFQRYLLLGLIALILCLSITEVDARRGGGGSRGGSRGSRGGGSWFGGGRSRSRTNAGTTRSRTSKGLIWGSTNYYGGLVIIPTAGVAGSYYQGYGNQCPSGCAVHGRCGTPDECSTSWWWYVLDFFTIVGLLLLCCFIESKRD